MTGRPVENAVELRGVAKRFDAAAAPLFCDLSLSIRSGDSVAIVGPSGCGKSTLLNMIALLEGADAGDVVHHGRPKSTRDVGTLSLAYIFQRDALLPWATVLENVLIGARCRHRDVPEALTRARAFLTRVGLDGVEGRYPSSLSGGQRQLVALAQNLLLEPDLLLLDEPFAHLDFPSKLLLEAELLRTVRLARATQARPMTMIIVTHDIAEAVVVADRVVAIGGYPDAPTGVIKDIQIDVAEAERDPVAMREGTALPFYFQETWDAIKSFRPEPGRAPS